MIIAAVDYISAIGIGDARRSEDVMLALNRALAEICDDVTVLGTLVVFVSDLAYGVDQGLDMGPVLSAAGGRFPVVWSSITYDPARISMSRFADLEREHELMLVGQHMKSIELD